ncbi:TPA: C40 family peptidase [Neisseria polysaccharea]|uniref:C40 family peptidase n=1 Tax=Neisseria polysaccharea TaxID=489 RepID=UPI0027E0C4B7|nr:C40 family peptidase [Neisseria polysaccharea]
MDSFFKPAVWAVLWLMFAVRPALADELTNLLSSREQILRQFAENGQYAQTARRNSDHTSGSADELIGNAMGLLGIAYRYGGTSVSTGFDCSGFMQHIFKRAMGINLPRTAAEQARMGAPVSRSELQPGDMVFFRTLGGSRISHVGLYIGNDRFIHAPRTGKNIEITSLSHKYWSGKYAFARRVKKNDPSRFLN